MVIRVRLHCQKIGMVDDLRIGPSSECQWQRANDL